MAGVDNRGTEASLNEGALKRVDPYVTSILDTAKYVAVYTFDNEAWTKTKIEGSLFVYRRSAEPLHNILVLNRLDKNNLIEAITPQLDLQRSEPYLLYKNSAGKIFGVWFFEQGECVRISTLVQSLMKQSVVRPAQVEADGPVDIFRMLSLAQDAYAANERGPVPDSTPKSVADFFAKAGTSSTNNEAPKVKRESESEGSGLGGLLHQLMANPVHSVQHIENQQRVTTPLSADAGLTTDPLKQFLRPRSMEMDGMAYLGPEPFTPTPRTAVNGNCNAGGGGGHLPHTISQPTPHHLNSNNANGSNKTIKSIPSSPPGFPVVDEGRNPQLMPPAMFTPKEESSLLLSRPCEITGRSGVEPEGGAFLRPATTAEPLTRNQLVQALQYLLRNDPHFITTIHEAYVKSLTEKLL